MKRILLSALLMLFLLACFLSCRKTTADYLSFNNSQKHYTDVKYITVTRAYDWGPAIDKVILCFENQIDPAAIDVSTLRVKSVRTYADYNNLTSKMQKNAKEHVVERMVTDVYVSDDKGKPSETGDCISIEMSVGPTMVETSPYNYNKTNGFNEIVETYYEVSLASKKIIRTIDGETLVFKPTGVAEKVGDIKIIADDFVNNQIFSYTDIDMTYAYYQPKILAANEGSVPLIIWLHGAGEGGTDTSVALLANEVVNLATESYQAFFGETGAYVLVPQVPTMWMDIDGKGTYNIMVYNSHGVSHYTEPLMTLISTFVADHPDIDKNRIYLGGCSSGGYMTVNMLVNYPDYFAAGFPICMAYWKPWLHEVRIEAIKDIPIWLTHALTDSTIPIAKGDFDEKTNTYQVKYDDEGNPILLDDFSNALYTKLEKMGATNIHYSRFDRVIDTSGLYFNEDGTPYEYLGHYSWIYALNNECVDIIDGNEVSLFEWLGQQTK